MDIKKITFTMINGVRNTTLGYEFYAEENINQNGEMDTIEIDKKLVAKANYNFEVGNIYKAIIESETNEKIFINKVKQIDVDIKVISKYTNILNAEMDKSELSKYLNGNIKDILDIKDETIKNIIISAFNENNLLKFFANNCIEITNELSEQIAKVIKKFDDRDILKFLNKKPYYVTYYFEHIPLSRLKLKKSLEAKIIKLLKENESKGNTFLTIDKLIEKVKLEVSKNLDLLVKEKLIEVQGERIYTKEIYEFEIAIIDNLLNRMSIYPKKLDKDEINKVKGCLEHLEYKLNKEQEKAIIESLQNNITIINGKAGSGKTIVIKNLINCIESLNKKSKIGIIALSGKAVHVIANKLKKESKVTPKTIHRFFKLKVNNYEEVEKIESLDYLIIDEMSMIDLKLLSIILRAIPNLTRIIFVGDLNQIEPIGVGQPIKDILESKCFSNIELLVNNRQKNNSIAKNALEVLKGNSKLISNTEFKLTKAGDLEINKIKVEYKKLLNEGYKENDILVMGVTNSTVTKINKAIRKTNKGRYRNFFIHGDIVMQKINNYDKKIYNGQIGQVVMSEIDNKNRTTIYVNYNEKTVKYKEKEINELEFAYAMTVHKSQGSQNKIAIIYLENMKEEYLNRNILYTAITRAEEKCIIIEQGNILKKIVNKPSEVKNSHIKEALIEAKNKKQIA